MVHSSRTYRNPTNPPSSPTLPQITLKDKDKKHKTVRILAWPPDPRYNV